jgi:hypothetical protein
MTVDPRHTAPDIGVRLAAPEQIVALGFRYWVLGRRIGCIDPWQDAWALYTQAFGLCGARRALRGLSTWVDTLCTTTTRGIDVAPAACPSFCRDECLAVAMIAACQTEVCPAMRACAFALIESSLIDRVVDDAHTFASTLMDLDHRVSAPPSALVLRTDRPRVVH